MPVVQAFYLLWNFEKSNVMEGLFKLHAYGLKCVDLEPHAMSQIQIGNILVYFSPLLY